MREIVSIWITLIALAFAYGSTKSYAQDSTMTMNYKGQPVAAAIAPSMSAFSQDVCGIPVAGAVSSTVIGVSGGSVYTDTNCERIKLIFEECRNLHRLRISQNQFIGDDEIIKEIRAKGYADEVCIAQWEVLEKEVQKLGTFENSVVVVDTSSSMHSPDYLPFDNACALGLIISNAVSGDFHNNVITFNDDPELWTAGQLYSKINPKDIKESLQILGYKGDSDKLIESAKSRMAKETSEGNLYKVDIPDEHIATMIDWDKPLGQQSAFVKKAINNLKKQVTPEMKMELGDDLNLLFGKDITPNQFLNTWEIIHPTGGVGIGERLLNEQGVKGIKYSDAGSRTRNIFDEEMARLRNKYKDDFEAAANDYIRTYHDTPAKKAKMKEYVMEVLAKKPTSNFVVFDPTDVKILERNNQPLTRKEKIEQEINKLK